MMQKIKKINEIVCVMEKSSIFAADFKKQI